MLFFIFSNVSLRPETSHPTPQMSWFYNFVIKYVSDKRPFLFPLSISFPLFIFLDFQTQICFSVIFFFIWFPLWTMMTIFKVVEIRSGTKNQMKSLCVDNRMACVGSKQKPSSSFGSTAGDFGIWFDSKKWPLMLISRIIWRFKQPKTEKKEKKEGKKQTTLIKHIQLQVIHILKRPEYYYHSCVFRIQCINYT